MDEDHQSRRDGWRLMRSELNEQRRWLILGILAGALWTGARLTGPLLAALAIDEGIIPGDGRKIVIYSLLILGVGVIQGIGTALRRYTAFRIAYRVETDLRQRLFAHLQQLHFAFHDRAQTGQLMARANSDIQQVNLVVVLLPLTVATTFLLAGVIIVMVLHNVLLAVLRPRCPALAQHRRGPVLAPAAPGVPAAAERAG